MPAQRQAALIVQLCHAIDTAQTLPDLTTLAASAGLSPSHVHRLFKKMTGMTPKAFANAKRVVRMQAELNVDQPITQTIYQAGYQSNSRFYEQSNQLLGMTPTNYRAGGTHTEIRFALGQCSLGTILVAATTLGICAILIDDDADFLLRDLQDRFPKAKLIGADAEFEQWVAQVVGLVETPQLGLALPLDLRGTLFQQRVWQALRAIPLGSTLSYSELAKRVGAPQAVRAVASACAANPIAVAIPCHRVVRIDGGLSGYRWGIERKRELLRRERETNQDDQ